MISSVLGAVIISMSTVSLLIAIKLGDQAVKNAGKHPLTKEEIDIVIRIPGYSTEQLDSLQLDIRGLKLP